MKKIAIAADHAGFELKEFFLKNFKDVTWLDLGPANNDRVDYPDYAKKLAEAIQEKKVEGGLLICGSGIGMSIAANKCAGVRAAHVESEISARLAKEHNNANVLCLGARINAPEYALEIFNSWLKASFQGGRHQDRVVKIHNLEK